MPLPDFIARPVFEILYHINRRQEGARIPPIKRRVTPVDGSRRGAFDALLDAALSVSPNAVIAYDLPYPKSEFLNYACDWRGFVAHGSPLGDLETLEPVRKSRDENEFGNRQQIFCSPDAMWAMWFAILDKDKFNLTRNGCVRQGLGLGRVKYYHFELPAVNKENSPFADGTIYLARTVDFPDKRPYPLLDWFNAEIEEWGATRPVVPLARLRISSQDFPYLDKVQFCL
jgi:hypothetical protein